jgi:hypothetical protein
MVHLNCLIMCFRLYSGLNRIYSEIQCASSIATKRNGDTFKNVTYSSLLKDSYKSLVKPDEMSFNRSPFYLMMNLIRGQYHSLKKDYGLHLLDFSLTAIRAKPQLQFLLN